MNDNRDNDGSSRKYGLHQAGFYAVLLVLVAAVCITALVLQQNERSKEALPDPSEVTLDAEGSLPGLPKAEEAVGLNEASRENEAALKHDDEKPGAEIRARSDENDRAENADKESIPTFGIITANQYSRPVAGALRWGYSKDELVYSNTFDDWRVHTGADYKASPGEAVRAIADGTVKSVYSDEMWGKCISVSHEGGLVSYYCGLAPEVGVKEGARVKAGDTLGAAGTSAAAEAAEEPHVHLEVTKDNKRIDPESLFAPLE